MRISEELISYSMCLKVCLVVSVINVLVLRKLLIILISTKLSENTNCGLVNVTSRIRDDTYGRFESTFRSLL